MLNRNANTRSNEPQECELGISCYLLRMSDGARNLAGADKLIEWFGRWPSFHDGEVLSLEPNRLETSRVRIHTWNMLAETDARGFYKHDKHCVVVFILEQISDLELAHFSPQNVISSLNVEKHEDGFRLRLHPCYGLGGYVVAKSIRIEFEPGIPPESKVRFESLEI
jgi:hypothetical protein